MITHNLKYVVIAQHLFPLDDHTLGSIRLVMPICFLKCNPLNVSHPKLLFSLAQSLRALNARMPAKAQTLETRKSSALSYFSSRQGFY